MTAYKNLGLFFNKHYFEKNLDFDEVLELLNDNLNNERRKALNKKYEERFARENEDKLFDASLPASSVYTTTFQDDFDRIELTTVYPGLLIGSGYPHESSVIGELKLGFHFDYTTGLPVIPGSSVKGLLRDAFEKADGEYVKELIKELNKKENVDLDIKMLIDDIFEGQQQGKPKPIYQRDIFFDAYPVSTDNLNDRFLANDYITPHKEPLKNPVPLQFLKVLPDVTFRFNFKLHDTTDAHGEVLLSAANKLELFKQILLDLGIGAKTNVGYGQFTDPKETQTHSEASNPHTDYEAIRKQMEIERMRKIEQEEKDRKEREKLLKEIENRRKYEEEQIKAKNETIENEIKKNGLKNLLGTDIKRIEKLDKIIKKFYNNKAPESEKENIKNFIQQLIIKDSKKWKKMKDKFWKITSRIVGKETAEHWYNEMIINK